MLDYAANGSLFWAPEQLRAWFEGEDPERATERLMSWLDPSEQNPEDAAEAFWQQVGTNLREGHIRLVFAADEIPASLQRLVEFLNEQMPRVEVLALEIRQYRVSHGKAGALVPRLVGQTSRAQAVKEQPAAAARRPAPWTADEVLASIAEAGEDAAAVASTVLNWATAHPHVRLAGGRGLSYPSVIMSADTGRGNDRFRGILALYAGLGTEPPMLEIRVNRMCRTPPYRGADTQARLTADLRALGIPRLDGEQNLVDKRPNIPLNQLTSARAERLLAIVDGWLRDVRAHAAEPEAVGDAEA
jgi:hypothetical protein